ncbi:hypothetical protein [Mucilaginibacter humi]|uniref:hypothetical protein n=1 Tax=Mucilaginibacter humi TaxID=2732510 RepID=UPI0037433332
MIAPSCSLLHTPFDLDLETVINPFVKNWMAFAKQKLNEINELARIIDGENDLLLENLKAISSRNVSPLIHKQEVKQQTAAITDEDANRISKFAERQKIQQQTFGLPLFPTTTIGSFPQTDDIRQLRAKLKKATYPRISTTSK